MRRSEITGRCMFIWKLVPVVQAEMDIQTMVRKATTAGLSGIWIKVADGALPYSNVTHSRGRLFRSVRDAMRDAGLSVWGWQVPYGGTTANAVKEADVCAQLANDLDLDGILMDAEGGAGYFTGGSTVATAYAQALSERLRNDGRGVAMCGNDIPRNFPDYPFEAFVRHADVNVPQVYYGGSPSVGNRLTRAMEANRGFEQPFVPVGAAWIGDNGGCASASACAERAREFIRLVGQYGFQGYGFWHWLGAPAELWRTLFEIPLPSVKEATASAPRAETTPPKPRRARGTRRSRR